MVTGLDFSLDSVNASSIGFETTDFPKLFMPPQKQHAIDLTGVHGLKQSSKKFTEHKFPVEGILIADTPESLNEKIENLKEFLYSDTDQKLIASIRSDRYRNVQFLEELEPPRNATTVELLLNFTCNDPFAYAVSEDDISELGIEENGYQLNIANAGTFYAFPIITITFNQSQSHVYIKNNNIENCRFDISKEFNTNDVLKIYFKEISIFLNDVYSPAGMADGGEGKAIPILFKKGNNSVELGTDDPTINIDVNIKFRKTYL